MSVTYYVTVAFDRDESGILRPGEAQEAPNASIARRRADVVADEIANEAHGFVSPM